MSGITSRRWHMRARTDRSSRSQAVLDVVTAIAVLATAAVLGGLAVGWVLSRAVLVLLGVG